jgi:hypothetical protein
LEQVIGDLVDKAFGSLDFIVRSKLTEKLGLGLVSKNLLNPTINRVQENATADVNVLPIKRSNNKFKFELRILTRLRSLRNSKRAANSCSFN